jgi:hypothetical protein
MGSCRAQSALVDNGVLVQRAPKPALAKPLRKQVSVDEPLLTSIKVPVLPDPRACQVFLFLPSTVVLINRVSFCQLDRPLAFAAGAPLVVPLPFPLFAPPS